MASLNTLKKRKNINIFACIATLVPLVTSIMHINKAPIYLIAFMICIIIIVYTLFQASIAKERIDVGDWTLPIK
jgi:hypothetical protein